MNLQDFLQKNWLDHFQFLDFEASFSDKAALDEAQIAIILSANSQNYERFIFLKEFKDIFKKINLRVDVFEIQNAQICAINLLKAGFLDKNDLLKALKILHKVSNNDLVISFIESLDLISVDKKNLFEENFKELDVINSELCKLSLDEQSKTRLKNTLQKFQNLEFNIAITGVMNAGKSSLLNALLKSDFLGVSNIPETANLTILKYGTSKKAKIYFWSKEEWNNILLNSKFSLELKEFIFELSKHIDIDSYIQEIPKFQEIALEDLKQFSSAKNKISALIKQIEIYADLEFLQNNISIVDTPGLDDVVVQREVLTKQYLKESDFLIHLMNASQSLTQKDLEFLIDCILNSRLSKFLIVITKADLLSQEQLDEVIDYTKQTLRAKLKDLNANLVEKIDFLCVSAKKANDFYKKLDNEQALKESKILEFEQYLFNELYSGEKSQVALRSYKKELLLELENLLRQYELQNQILKENSQGFNEENAQLFSKLKDQELALSQAKKDIKESILSLENSESGVENLLKLLAQKLKERLIDELKYLKDKAQKLNITRILSIVDICVKDGINDILRELKFENFKKIESLKARLATKYEFLKDDFDNGFETFKEELAKNIENIFSSDKFTLLKMEIRQICEQKTDIFILETKLDAIINEGFKNFQISKLLKDLNINKTFFDFLEQKLQNYEKIQIQKFENIQKLLKNLKDKNIDSINSYEQNSEKITRLIQLKMELLNAN